MYTLMRNHKLLLPGLLMTLGACAGTDIGEEADELAPALFSPIPRWVALGGAINSVPGSNAGAPSLAIDRGETLQIGFQQSSESAGSHAVVFRWTNNRWSQVGEALSRGSPGIAIDGHRRVYACMGWALEGPYVSRWQGSSWTPLGGDIGTEIGCARPNPFRYVMTLPRFSGQFAYMLESAL